jgi:hypothetical protein
VSDHLDFLHPLYTDYDPGDLSGVPSSPGTRISGSPPDTFGLTRTDRATIAFWQTYNLDNPPSTSTPYDLSLVNPTTTVFDFAAPHRFITPELQYPFETVPQANVSNALKLTFDNDNDESPAALSPLVTLATVATLVRPASAPVVNTDKIVAPVPRRQEEGPLDYTPRVPPPSPSYHVHTPLPSPEPCPASAEARLDYFIPSPSSSLDTNSSLSAEEEEDIADQENRPPSPPAPIVLDPYAPPPCTTVQHRYHPHQFYLVRHQDGDIWRPASEVLLHTLLEYPTHQDLLAAGPIFPSVFPFKAPSHHTGVIAPTDTFQARLFDIPSLTICAHAGYASPANDTPLGYIQYSYRPSIRSTFLRHSSLIRLCFSNALVISQIFDFLDGRRIYIYGRLRFDGNSVYITNQGFHTEDTCWVYPQLLRYTLMPRLPADPFSLVRLFPEENCDELVRHWRT